MEEIMDKAMTIYLVGLLVLIILGSIWQDR